MHQESKKMEAVAVAMEHPRVAANLEQEEANLGLYPILPEPEKKDWNCKKVSSR